MPREYDIKEAQAFLQARNPDIEVTPEALYQKIHRGRLPATMRGGPHGKRYVIQESDLLAVQFRRPKHGGISPQGNRSQPDWGSIFNLTPEFWLGWKPVEVHSDEDLAKLAAVFGELVDDRGLSDRLYEKYGVRYKPHTFKQRRQRGTLLGVGRSAARGGWWYPTKQIEHLWWRPHFVKD